MFLDSIVLYVLSKWVKHLELTYIDISYVLHLLTNYFLRYEPWNLWRHAFWIIKTHWFHITICFEFQLYVNMYVISMWPFSWGLYNDAALLLGIVQWFVHPLGDYTMMWRSSCRLFNDWALLLGMFNDSALLLGIVQWFCPFILNPPLGDYKMNQPSS